MTSKAIILVLAGLSVSSFSAAADSSAKQVRNLASIGMNTSACLFAKGMEVHGHRGMDGYPNNTISSFKAAFDVGVDFAELDLQVTKDNHILVAHDAVPNVGTERCGLDGKSLQKTAIRDLSFDQAKHIRCGASTFNETVTEPIPELSEVFAALKDRKTHAGKLAGLNIEIKYFQDQVQYYPPANEYLDMIIKVIRDSGWTTDRFIVQSFNHDILKLLKQKASDIQVVPLDGDARKSEESATLLGSSKVTPGFWQVTPELIHQLHKKNIKAIIWTPNTENELRFVINSGADGVITDHPDLFFKIRDELCQ